MIKFTNWAGRLNGDGEALAAYLEAQGFAFPPVPEKSLLSPAAVWFWSHMDEAAAKWQEYQTSIERMPA